MLFEETSQKDLLLGIVWQDWGRTSLGATQSEEMGQIHMAGTLDTGIKGSVAQIAIISFQSYHCQAPC